MRSDAPTPVAHRSPIGATDVTRGREVIRPRTIDAVVVATTVGTHYRPAVTALEAGKHVFIEKPLSASTAEARDLMRAGGRRPRAHARPHVPRQPAGAEIKELIDGGERGRDLLRVDERVNLGLHQPDVSVVLDLGPHDFSILRYWLDEPRPRYRR